MPPPFDVLDIRKALGLTQGTFGALLGTSSSTIGRWERSGIPATIPMRTLEALHQLRELRQLGSWVYGDRFIDFLRMPMGVLGGKAPYRLMMGGDVERVYQVLIMAYEGTGD